MATGIPRLANGSSGGDYRIEYGGKVSTEDILGGPAAALSVVLATAAEPRNRLIYGDNLRVLRALLDDHDVAGKVRMVYIDPPYATRARFESRTQRHAYHDELYGAAYLEFLRERLILLRELLADDGSIYVHLDDNMAFPAKVVMDEIFGPGNFRNLICRTKSNPKNFTKKQYGNVADYLLFYTKTDAYVWNQPVRTWTESSAAKEYQYTDESGRRFKKVPVHAPGLRNGATGQLWRGKEPPPGKHWQYPPATLDEMDARGEIYWSPTGNPRRKVFLDASKGASLQDIWVDVKDAHNQNIHITGYPTEKNSELVRRLVEASSNPGDLVMDAFVGSGTLPEVATALGRDWIAIDNSPLAIETTLHRLVHGTKAMGDFVSAPSETEHPQLPGMSAQFVQALGLSVLVDSADGMAAAFTFPDAIVEFNPLVTTNPSLGKSGRQHL